MDKSVAMCGFPEIFVVEAVERGAKVVSHPVYFILSALLAVRFRFFRGN